MTTIITRLYATNEQAEEAVKTAAAKKFPKVSMKIVSGANDPAESTAELKALGVYPGAAAVYADKVAGGHAVLVMQASFGKAYKAAAAVENTGAIHADVKHTEVYAGAMTSPTPESTRHLPELLNVTMLTGEKLPYSGQTWLPFHSFFRIPLLSKKVARAGLLTNTLFSKMVGMPLTIKYRES